MDIIALPCLQLLAIRESMQAFAKLSHNTPTPIEEFSPTTTIEDVAEHWLSISGVEVKLPRNDLEKALEAYEAELTKLGVL